MLSDHLREPAAKGWELASGIAEERCSARKLLDFQAESGVEECAALCFGRPLACAG